MKLKIIIAGPRVHDVGYRPYLTELAMRLAIKGFEVFNDEENGRQAVIALVESDQERVVKFCRLAKDSRPELAIVDDVKSEDYAGDVMPLWQFASINTASQMNKAIPVLLKIQDNTSVTPQILEEVKGIREEIQPGFALQLRCVKEDIIAIKERLGLS
ncbi:MAG: acylphosphatase [Methanotrichaceae archaeon]|nr:acylphosphatase [Methanotrichaceae archaeon]